MVPLMSCQHWLALSWPNRQEHCFFWEAPDLNLNWPHYIRSWLIKPAVYMKLFAYPKEDIMYMAHRIQENKHVHLTQKEMWTVNLWFSQLNWRKKNHCIRECIWCMRKRISHAEDFTLERSAVWSPTDFDSAPNHIKVIQVKLLIIRYWLLYFCLKTNTNNTFKWT